jgi:hypothetical protein
MKFGNDVIYFPEPYAAQLRPDGVGLGASVAMARADVFSAAQNVKTSRAAVADAKARGLQ